MVTLLLRLTLLAYPLSSTYLTVAQGWYRMAGAITLRVITMPSPAHVAPPKCGVECLG